MRTHGQEEFLGKRCSITFQIGQKTWQTSHGLVTEFKGSLVKTVAPRSERFILYRQKVVFDNGDKEWLDLGTAAMEGRLQWLHAPEEACSQKIKNDEDCLVNSDPVADNLSINAAILKDVLPKIVAFLYPSDRYPTALANSNLRNAVEAHSKQTLDRIIKNHAVDSTFLARIQEQTNLETFETQRPKPVDLPFRYQLAKAKTTRLYMLVPSAVNRYSDAWPAMNYTNKNCILFAEVDFDMHWTFRIYDLATKRCIRTFSCHFSDHDIGLPKASHCARRDLLMA